jgi:hypothetical protein
VANSACHRLALCSFTPVFHRYFDGMQSLTHRPLSPGYLNSAKQVGLDAAGKTTILYKLKLGEIVTTIPTIGQYRFSNFKRETYAACLFQFRF